MGFDVEIKVCIWWRFELGPVLRGCRAEYLATESLDVFLRSDASVKGQSLTPNPVFKLLVGLAGV